MLAASDQCFIQRLEINVHVGSWSERPRGDKIFPGPTFLPHSSLPWKYSKPAQHEAMSPLSAAFFLHQKLSMAVLCPGFLDFVYVLKTHEQIRHV